MEGIEHGKKKMNIIYVNSTAICSVTKKNAKCFQNSSFSQNFRQPSVNIHFGTWNKNSGWYR